MKDKEYWHIFKIKGCQLVFFSLHAFYLNIFVHLIVILKMLDREIIDQIINKL